MHVPPSLWKTVFNEGNFSKLTRLYSSSSLTTTSLPSINKHHNSHLIQTQDLGMEIITTMFEIKCNNQVTQYYMYFLNLLIMQ